MGSRSPYADWALQRRLLREIRPHGLHLAGLGLWSLLGTPIALLLPLPVQIAVDTAIGGRPLVEPLRSWVPDAWQRSTEGIVGLLAGIVVLATLLLHAHALASWAWTTWLGQRLALDWRARLFRHLQRLSLSFHDLRGTADSVYRVQSDAAAIQGYAVNGLVPLLTNLVKVVVMVAVVARIDAAIALVAVLGGPVVFLLTHLWRRRLRARWSDVRDRDSLAMAVVHETLGALRVVKAFGQEERERERYEQRAHEHVRASLRAVLAHGTFDLVTGLVLGVATAVVLAIGVLHVRAGELSAGSLLLVMGYLSMLFLPLRELGQRLGELNRSLASAERVYSVLDERPEAAERPDAVPIARARGAVTFEGVAFGYDRERPLFRGVTLAVPAGARVGIAGRTGSGKTTLLSLLPRFYDPTEGRILLDGLDLRDVRLADLREQFAIVLQEPVLFSTTVRENIAYGRPGATQAEIERAARDAGVHDAVLSFPQGYDTRVGERGLRLSGGERQRVSLARAFLRDAPVLILDEPTSSVDVATEAGIMEATQRLMEGRTTFLIAHRLSTLEGCDVRLEVADGRVLVRGHDLAGVAIDGPEPPAYREESGSVR
jgi:ATP-binding cassette subfamily B protein